MADITAISGKVKRNGAARTRYTLTLEPIAGAPTVRMLRWLLKRLAPQHHLRRVDIREISAEEKSAS